MIKADNAAIAEENSSDPSTSTAGWNARLAARQTYDKAVQGINFPSSFASDAQGVDSADVALESIMGTISVNTNDVTNYNALFAQEQTAEAAFQSAQSKLSNDLGLVSG
jgi:hypothetical protein